MHTYMHKNPVILTDKKCSYIHVGKWKEEEKEAEEEEEEGREKENEEKS